MEVLKASKLSLSPAGRLVRGARAGLGVGGPGFRVRSPHRGLLGARADGKACQEAQRQETCVRTGWVFGVQALR